MQDAPLHKINLIYEIKHALFGYGQRATALRVYNLIKRVGNELILRLKS